MSAVKIGDTLHRFDVNRRVYREPNRVGGGGLVYAEHFTAHRISGETPQSWLIAGFGKPAKVNKRTLREAGRNGFGGFQWFTDKGKTDDIWIHDYRHDIARAVADCRDADTLRRVGEIIGYDPTGTTER